MKNIQDIAALISIRAFLFSAVDNLSIKLNREEIKSVQNKIPQLDRIIVEQMLKFDLTEIGKEKDVSHSVRQLSFTGEDPEITMAKVRESERTTKNTFVNNPGTSKITPTKEEAEKLFNDTDGK